MAPPRKPENDRKRPNAVSLCAAETALFQALGGSKWLALQLDGWALQLVDATTPSGGGALRKAAQDVLNAHARRRLELMPVMSKPIPGLIEPAKQEAFDSMLEIVKKVHPAREKHDALTPLQKHMAYVRKRHPQAACKREGITWAVYNKPKGPARFQITGGWMTAPQAWERASAAIANPKPYQRNAPNKARLEDRTAKSLKSPDSGTGSAKRRKSA